MTFRHSGDIGDIIYGLPTVRAMGGGEILLSRRVNTNLTEEGAKAFAPLGESQPYVSKVVWSNEDADHNMDVWRNQYWPWITLADMQLRAFDLPSSERDRPWISVEPNRQFRVLLHRSPRYRNHKFPWDRVLRKYGPLAAFLGMPWEHEEFVKTVGPVPYFPTADYLSLARVIAGCELFIGNQSSPFAVAEAMKKPVVQEVCLNTPNCVFDRAGAMHDIDGTVLLPELK